MTQKMPGLLLLLCLGEEDEEEEPGFVPDAENVR